jgi:hypothetical protein
MDTDILLILLLIEMGRAESDVRYSSSPLILPFKGEEELPGCCGAI